MLIGLYVIKEAIEILRDARSEVINKTGEPDGAMPMSDRDYWERHARFYDASVRRALGGPLPRMLELASEAVRGKGKVLEVAAGTGIVTSAIAQACDAVVATDYATAMVESLERRIRDNGLGNVTCERPTFINFHTRLPSLML